MLFGVDLFDRADGILHAAGLDPNVVARLKIDADGALAAGHSLIFLVRQRNRLASRADKTGHAARVAHDVPRLRRLDHLDQDVAGKELVLNGMRLAIADLDDFLNRHGDFLNQVAHAVVFHRLDEIVGDFVFITRIGMHNIPKGLLVRHVNPPVVRSYSSMSFLTRNEEPVSSRPTTIASTTTNAMTTIE